MRRGQMEVIRDILLSIGSGVSKPTLIMYDTKLSWIGLKRYLPILEEKELVECRVDTKNVQYAGSNSEPLRKLSQTPRTYIRRHYVLTPKGVEMRNLLNELDWLFE
jgi:hypothetical protein